MSDFKKNENRLPKNADILVFWEKKKFQYPELYQVAQVLLGVPATQVSVERAFSCLNFVFSERRHNLKDSILEAILLIRLNLFMFKSVSTDLIFKNINLN